MTHEVRNTKQMLEDFKKDQKSILKNAEAAHARLIKRDTGVDPAYVVRQDLRDVLSVAAAMTVGIVELKLADFRAKAVEPMVLAVAPSIRNLVDGAIAKALAEHDRSTTRALVPRWKGVYVAGEAYDRDSLVAHAHGLWIAEQTTAGRPGAAESGWKLVVKSPR